MPFQKTNFAATTLSTSYASGATSMVVASGGGALFPTPSGTSKFRATIVRNSDGATEIVEVTARSTDTMTVTRAMESTTALAFVTGDKFEMRDTAGTEANNAQLDGVNVFSAGQSGAFIPLADAATIAVDLSLGNQFNIIFGGNRTFGVPTNIKAGQQGVINCYQDVTGSRVPAFAWIYGVSAGGTLSFSTAGCTKDMLVYSVDYYGTGTTTVTIATPGVFTLNGHGFVSGQKCQLTTTGALPTGLTASTTYYVHVIDANTYHLCTSVANVTAGTYIATSGSQSGVHTIVCSSITVALSKATP